MKYLLILVLGFALGFEVFASPLFHVICEKHLEVYEFEVDNTGLLKIHDETGRTLFTGKPTVRMSGPSRTIQAELVKVPHLTPPPPSMQASLIFTQRVDSNYAYVDLNYYGTKWGSGMLMRCQPKRRGEQEP